jgi:hypothetical protein
MHPFTRGQYSFRVSKKKRISYPNLTHGPSPNPPHTGTRANLERGVRRWENIGFVSEEQRRNNSGDPKPQNTGAGELGLAGAGKPENDVISEKCSSRYPEGRQDEERYSETSGLGMHRLNLKHLFCFVKGFGLVVSV